MALEYYASLADVAGGIAILVSLIYVGYQIRQSNRFATAENMRFIADSQVFDPYNFGIVARGMHDLADLELEEKGEFHRYMFKLLNHYNVIIETRKIGLVSQATVDNWTAGIATVLVTKGGDAWWNGGGKSLIGMEERQNVLDEYLSKNRDQIVPFNKTFKWMDLG